MLVALVKLTSTPNSSLLQLTTGQKTLLPTISGRCFKEIRSSLAASVQEENRTDKKDEDSIFCELLASQLRNIGLLDKRMITMKISQLIYE